MMKFPIEIPTPFESNPAVMLCMRSNAITCDNLFNLNISVYQAVWLAFKLGLIRNPAKFIRDILELTRRWLTSWGELVIDELNAAIHAGGVDGKDWWNYLAVALEFEASNCSRREMSDASLAAAKAAMVMANPPTSPWSAMAMMRSAANVTYVTKAALWSVLKEHVKVRISDEIPY